MKLSEAIKNPKGSRISGIYRIGRFEVKTARTGKAYGDCLISDPSGEIPAKYWDIPEEAAALAQQQVLVRVEAALDFFKEAPQLTIMSLTAPAAAEVEQALRELGLMSALDLNALFADLEKLIGTIQQEQLRRVLEQIFVLNKDFAIRFRCHPGAVHNHHAWIGGLLEHTMEVAWSAEDYCLRNNCINRDLLLTVALLHDIGKVWEIAVDDLGLPVGFTKQGKLLRHISLGMEQVDQACRELGTDPEISLVLKHCILSHHGQTEWGSPVEPMLLEADVLHYLDNLSAKTDQFSREGKRLEPGSFAKSYGLRREVYRPDF